MNKYSKATVGILAGFLILGYGIFVLIAGLRASKGDNALFNAVNWYELLFLLIGAVFFSYATVGKSAFSMHLSGLFVGLFIYLNVARRLGGGINYANFFGLIFVAQGLAALFSRLALNKSRTNTVAALDFLVMGITFICSIFFKLYWIIAIGVVFCIGLTVMVIAIGRKNSGAVNEDDDYTPDKNRRYNG